MEPEFITLEFALTVSFILWGIFVYLLFRVKFRTRIDNYFAGRRHLRREKKRKEIETTTLSLGVVTINEVRRARQARHLVSK